VCVCVRMCVCMCVRVWYFHDVWDLFCGIDNLHSLICKHKMHIFVISRFKRIYTQVVCVFESTSVSCGHKTITGIHCVVVAVI